MALPSTKTALDLAAARKVLPLDLNTREIREALTVEIRRASVFSARTTSASYLATMKRIIEQRIAGKIDNGTARNRLKAKLAAIGYVPEKGKEGSIEDLRSDRRLNLILQTQLDLWQGAARNLRETTPERIAQFPAWQYLRIGSPKVPRDWEARWATAGGTLVNGQMIAWKWDAVWTQLGNSDLFDDALDTDHPPFAFSSEMGLVEVTRQRAERLLGEMAVLKGGPADVPRIDPARRVVIPKISSPLADLPDSMVQELKDELGAVERNGRLELEAVTEASLKTQAELIRTNDAARAARVAKYQKPTFSKISE